MAGPGSIVPNNARTDCQCWNFSAVDNYEVVAFGTLKVSKGHTVFAMTGHNVMGEGATLYLP